MRLINPLLAIALASSLALSACGSSSFSAKASRTLGIENADDAKPDNEGKDDGQGRRDDDLSADETKKLEEHCGKKNDFAQIIRLNGNQETQSLRLSTDTLIIMNGNMPKLSVEGLDQDIARVCIYMRGNEGEFTMLADKAIAKLSVLQRGNLNKGTLHLEGEITSLSWDAAGNQNHLAVDGAGSFECPSDESNGNENTLVSQKP